MFDNVLEMPRITRVVRDFPRDKISDIPECVQEEFLRLNLGEILKGKKVGITAGSRGIGDIAPILKSLADLVRKAGGTPVLLAAMGSHGGGTEAGQREVLDSLGLTESAVGARIAACVESLEIGETPGGLKAYMLKSAFEVDAIIPVNRVKAHTAFHGEVESGLFKMLVVGLGGPKGAAQFHSRGSAELANLLIDVGELIVARMPVIAGFAILENAYEETAAIVGVPGLAIRAHEPKILDRARAMMPALPVNVLDALIIEEMGKNFSGTGVDTNIVGRLRIEGVPEPETPAIQKIAVLDLSPESHGNANGVGLTDVTTQRLVDKIDREATYLNCATTGFLIRCATPVYMATERASIELLLRSLGARRPEDIRLIQIPNTLHLAEFFASEALLPELKGVPGLCFGGEPFEMTFDDTGDLTHRIGRGH